MKLLQICNRIATRPDMSIRLPEELLRIEAIARSILAAAEPDS